MKKYIIKPEYLSLYGDQANAYTVITEDEVARLSKDWETPVDEILEQLIEDDSDNHGWRLIYRLPGCGMTREQINQLISFDNGDPEEFFPTDEDYQASIREGFVKTDGYYTTVWADD